MADTISELREAVWDANLLVSRLRPNIKREQAVSVREAFERICHAVDAVSEDAALLDWIQETFQGTGETLMMGGVCYWALDKLRAGLRSKVTRLGEGEDLRDAIRDARASAARARPASETPAGDGR